VSQYRLAAHLLLAAIIFAAIMWTAMSLDRPYRSLRGEGTWAAATIIVLILLQIGTGGFVAGIDAGMGYNTWPQMDGKLIPDGLWIMTPAWRNLFENALTVQFMHRMIAYATAIYIGVNALRHRNTESALLLLLVLLQMGIGIATLLHQVPLSLALCHQGGALLLLAAALWNLHCRSATRSPDPDPR
jgi:cytochrome c oxidase assembly protein subunit 15